ncbi:glycosyl transferase, partial [Helicobacter sp.]|uniref:glycosyl transferase n=1 Tax=Helicobacter sp. TaxID=218 RepID=UPI002A911B3B
SPNLRIFEVSNKLTKNLYYQVFLQNCIGDYLVFIDLEENDIDSFLEILTKAREYDIVIGVRKQKIQSLTQKFTSYLFYRFIKIFYRYTIREDYSDFCVLNRKVINYLLKEKLDIYLLRLIQFDSRFSKCEYPFMPICNNKKNNFFDSVELGIDIIIQNSYKTLRLATILSLFISLFNFLYLMYVLSSYFLNINVIGGWTSTSIYLVTTNSCLFLILSILGEYLRTILMRAKHNNLHEIIEERSNFSLYVNSKNVRTN